MLEYDVGRFLKNPKLSINPESAVLPVGITGLRPAVPTKGAVRFNSSLLVLEFYNGATWKQIAAQGYTVLVVDDLGILGGSVFTMSQAANGNTDDEKNVLVVVGNIPQNPLSAYTVTGTTLTMSSPVTPGDRVLVYHGLNSTVVS